MHVPEQEENSYLYQSNQDIDTMNIIENIYPYAIVENDGKYGVFDYNTDKLVVPCEYEWISNPEEEESGYNLWDDCGCIQIQHDGVYGFFTDNGVFIEPKYDTFTIDPCGNHIHVQIRGEYGILESPTFAFRPSAYEDTLFYIDENDETQYEL